LDLEEEVLGRLLPEEDDDLELVFRAADRGRSPLESTWILCREERDEGPSTI